MFTNGTVATEEDWEIIRKRYPNVSVATSLHSYIKEEHEKVTHIKDSYNKTVNTLHILKELNIPVKYAGLGEGIEDLEQFDAKKFVDSIL